MVEGTLGQSHQIGESSAEYFFGVCDKQVSW